MPFAAAASWNASVWNGKASSLTCDLGYVLIRTLKSQGVFLHGAPGMAHGAQAPFTGLWWSGGDLGVLVF